ncbi:MAG: hypothetical protein K2X82_31470 [Gemmataceae bacterium]|nr:hypothetical protein [Gemmataceae bacterium]
MASNTTPKDPAKTVDVPPYGPRNADPITDQPGSHPVETGVGAVIGGVASGLAVGAVGGPVGAVVGAIIGGAAAGGLAGKGVGELLDPTTEDNWIREALGASHPADTPERVAAHRRAFRYGSVARERFPGRMFKDAEAELRAGWEDVGEAAPWAEVYASVRAGFDGTAQHPTLRS